MLLSYTWSKSRIAALACVGGDAMPSRRMPERVETALSRTLGEYVAQRGYTQHRLAHEAGVPRATINHWLTGKVEWPYFEDQVLRVAMALGLRRGQVNRLLRSAGFGHLDSTLRSGADPELKALLQHWDTSTRNNLPVVLTSFIGRDDEVERLAEMLCGPDVRLLTLTGPGGSGKTRLGLQVATEVLDTFPDGVFFVPLAQVSVPEQVAPTVLRALGLADAPGMSPGEQLALYLQARRLLLVLDNLEQVVAAGPGIVHLLHYAPHVRALVTSRVPLRVSGEHEWPVRPFPLPEAGHDPATNPAVSLFSARATAVNPTFQQSSDTMDAIVTICSRLDGLPLAIELAAARCRTMTPGEILAGFPSLLDLGSDGPRDAAQRHQTLRATVRWSEQLLGTAERRLFARLSVFSGGWTEEAATAICTSTDSNGTAVRNGLATLREASLIEWTGDGTTARYSMLETIREYAREQLDTAGETSQLRYRHAAWFLALAEERPLFIPESRPDDWYERIERDLDNLRAALGWASEAGEHTLLARIVGALWPFWHEFQQATEGRRWVDLALQRQHELPPELRAELLTAASTHAMNQGDFTTGIPVLHQSLTLWKELGNTHGQAIVLQQMAWGAYARGAFEEALETFAEALKQWRALGERLGIARGLSDYGFHLYTCGSFEAADVYIEEAHALFIHPDNSPEDMLLGLARTQTDRGLSALLRGDAVTAAPLLNEAIEHLQRTRGSYLLPAVVFYHATALCLLGDLAGAASQYRAALLARERAGDVFGVSLCLLGFAAVAHRRNEPERAALLCGAVHNLQQQVGIALAPTVQALYDSEVALVLAQLTSEAFHANFARGEALTVPEAIALALQ